MQKELLDIMIKRRLLTLFLLAILMCVTQKTYSQDTYYCELGIQGGAGNVLGDVNTKVWNNLQPVVGGFFKYLPNGHWAVKAQFDLGTLGIDSKLDPSSVNFSAITTTCEFNFFNYGAKSYEEYHSRVSPYVYAGTGVALYNSQVALTLPFGLGCKFKLNDRINLGVNWTMNKVLNDNLDGVDDPIGLNGGVLNNRDWYSNFGVYLSFNFLKICTPCRNGVLQF